MLPFSLPGCGGSQAEAPSPPPPAAVALTPQEKQFVDSVKALPANQREAYLVQNRETWEQNPNVQNKLREFIAPPFHPVK